MMYCLIEFILELIAVDDICTCLPEVSLGLLRLCVNGVDDIRLGIQTVVHLDKSFVGARQ